MRDYAEQQKSKSVRQQNRIERITLAIKYCSLFALTGLFAVAFILYATRGYV